MSAIINLILVFLLIFNWGFAARKAREKTGAISIQIINLLINIGLTMFIAYVVAWNSVVPIWVWWGLAALMAASVTLIVYHMLERQSVGANTGARAEKKSAASRN
ncbi:hypothetical protein [Corynebacterium propinquum]|uniref:Uncharacterized protein n=2 Tax=Corynebacterium propinquum TaxID=43769 RepID=A0ABT7G0Z0_9CORY|nr:hypothetical protein [Corynebacterium propinquum]MDK4300395.1 hypothetical protein [Corynebacterium propinquum]MDK4312851.1 hypothetical protein [Corynebacterium propinquum]UQV61098.1 hypothetical protein L9H28_04580 [Corynebacterium propinquum]